ncbi:hypothetical protein OG530_40085 [Streptomyces decoyicus]
MTAGICTGHRAQDSPPTATVTWKHMVLPQAAAAVVSYMPTAIE